MRDVAKSSIEVQAEWIWTTPDDHEVVCDLTIRGSALLKRSGKVQSVDELGDEWNCEIVVQEDGADLHYVNLTREEKESLDTFCHEKLSEWTGRINE